eukprot:CAMPEP_0113633596 /NCGR_PEP_ID=MMETSP0017_2-20120614/17485_1 /TAXON_ID=2856 /ORGANISM="Cylindrotheca closterium" /LENGTH=623 /DNA_ID=CAMNT_0000544243 /DNA_START=92 /DNA_END=1963 /DNA_ORIENTATION=- /assembly_acc=CAM_ASM_000147
MVLRSLLRSLLVCCIVLPNATSFSLSALPKTPSSTSLASSKPITEAAALERTASHLKRLKLRDRNGSSGTLNADLNAEALIAEYLRLPANALKGELKKRSQPTKGKKPDLARRLAEYEIAVKTGVLISADDNTEVKDWNPAEERKKGDIVESSGPIDTFCGLKLSQTASEALGKANFRAPSPIQRAAIPAQVNGESIIMHAQTGSGKTLAYLLPITEQLWKDHEAEDEEGYGFILTPTRELAAQVAGVASVLAPPGTVRMVSHPTNLMSDGLKDRGERENGGRLDDGDGRTMPRLFIGSAKSIMGSLYGDGKMPAPPTTKPEAKYLLANTRWMVMDEVDRLLDTKRGRNPSTGRNKHEKPAAIVTSAVARLTFGRAQVVSVSATVGRTLKRELSRVLGLPPKEFPAVVRGNDSMQEEEFRKANTGGHLGRAVTIPETVNNYVVPVDSSSTGKILTSAFFVLRELNRQQTRRILLVLTKGSGISTQNTLGALKHFGCQPEPRSLLDVLEADGTDRLIEVHREVSGATGVGEAKGIGKDEGYVLVTGEDSVRGLHLDGLDAVVVVGRAQGPDEYTHIAGRTGRAGRRGSVFNVVSSKEASAVKAWEKMLDIEFLEITIEEIPDQY